MTTILGDRFELLECLGKGGMAEVYRARDRRLGRDVAIKLLNAACSRDPGLIERFRQESSALAQLSNPRIVTLLDTGETADGRFYLVMERLRGEGLDAVFRGLKRRGEVMPWPRLASIVRQVCAALQAAHARQIVHRDIKPSNLFRLEDSPDGEDFVKILDFGIAKILASMEPGVPDDKIHLTASGMFVGTPHYAAPEAIEPQSYGVVGAQVDVYALGVILYQGVVGVLPHEGEPRSKILYKTAFEEPPPVRERAKRAIPPTIEALVMKAIAREPERRHASVRELSEAIAAVPEEEVRALGRAMAATEKGPKGGALEDAATRPEERRPAAQWTPAGLASVASAPARSWPVREPEGAVGAAAPARSQSVREPEGAAGAAAPARSGSVREPEGAAGAAAPARSQSAREPEVAAGAAAPVKLRAVREPEGGAAPVKSRSVREPEVGAGGLAPAPVKPRSVQEPEAVGPARGEVPRVEVVVGGGVEGLESVAKAGRLAARTVRAPVHRNESRLSKAESAGPVISMGPRPEKASVSGSIEEQGGSVGPTEPGARLAGVPNPPTGRVRALAEGIETPLPAPIAVHEASSNLGVIIMAVILIGVIAAAWWIMPDPPPERPHAEATPSVVEDVVLADRAKDDGAVDVADRPVEPAAPAVEEPPAAPEPSEPSVDPAEVARAQSQLRRLAVKFETTFKNCTEEVVLFGAHTYALGVSLAVEPPRRTLKVVELEPSSARYKRLPEAARRCALAELRKLRVAAEARAEIGHEFVTQ